MFRLRCHGYIQNSPGTAASAPLAVHPSRASAGRLAGNCQTRLLPAGYNRKLGLSNEIFVLGDSAVLTVLGQVSFMPVLVLAARLCPEVNRLLLVKQRGKTSARRCICVSSSFFGSLRSRSRQPHLAHRGQVV